MAVFTDGATPVDRTNWSNTIVSYYPLGGALALALDLMLRERSDGRVTLDDYMRAMWRVYGKPGGRRQGYVDRPYTAVDAEARLADVSGDRVFAREFFRRYIQGLEIPDYARLLARAGFAIRKPYAGRPWWGDIRLESRGDGTYIAGLVPTNSPAHAAGLEQDDELREIDTLKPRGTEDVSAILGRRSPGDRIRVVYIDRTGVEKTTTVTLAEHPYFEVVPVDATGGILTREQRAFRDRWLGAR
jgi:predicted metalloprotease with PDZ domain